MSSLLIVFMFILFVVPSVIYHEYFLTLTFIIFGLVFGFIEYMADYYTGNTVSQHMWQLMTTNKKEGWVILGCMLLGWICLLVHLGMRFKK
jgi:hypothetical protein